MALLSDLTCPWRTQRQHTKMRLTLSARGCLCTTITTPDDAQDQTQFHVRCPQQPAGCYARLQIPTGGWEPSTTFSIILIRSKAERLNKRPSHVWFARGLFGCMSPTCPVPLHSAFKGHRGGRSDNLHACDPYHTPYHTPHVAWLADNLLPAPQDQGGWGQVSNQCSPQPQPQPLSTTTSISNMTSLHANIRSVSLARPPKTLILQMSPNSRFNNAWHCDRSMRSEASFSPLPKSSRSP
jgi:hypothetical protein